MEWHAHSGLALTFIEGQETIHSQARLSLDEKLSLTNLRECVPQELLSSATAYGDSAHGHQDSSKSTAWPASATALILLGFVSATIVTIFFFGRLQNGSWSIMQGSRKQQYSLLEVQDEDESNDIAQEKSIGSGNRGVDTDQRVNAEYS